VSNPALAVPRIMLPMQGTRTSDAARPIDDAAGRRSRRAGVTLFRNGFRPFFFGAGVWAVIAMAVRIAELSGYDVPVYAFHDPTLWHANAFLFGYGGAVVAGFALTAIPNWTGRLPIAGGPLAALFALWLAGRIALFMPQLPATVTMAIDVAFLPVLAGVAAREIIAGKNLRNIPVCLAIALLGTANIVLHLEALDVIPQERYGVRIGIAVLIGLMGLIGGRIVPSFTTNWLARHNKPRLAPTVAVVERLTHASTGAAFLLWIAFPYSPFAGAALLLASTAHAVRLYSWQGWRTLAEPLVLVLHAGYAWIPVGLFLLGTTILLDPAVSSTTLHALTVGAIGTMTLAVMTRATLGHTGRELRASAGTAVLYAAISASAVARVLAGFVPQFGIAFFATAGALWILAFGLFVAIYGPMHLQPRVGETS